MAPRAQRRPDALSRERIVATAVELLDADGAGGLTFRAPTARLATGPGAVYWHVANRDELLAAATDAVVAAALAGTADQPAGSPQDRVRAVALALFDAIDEHPWVAAQLSASSWQATQPRILEAVGREVRALGVPEDAWFTVATALLGHILGAAGQNAVNARVLGPGADRDEFLGAVSHAWSELDPEDYAFTRAVAAQMREHDDRAQFLDGVTLVLAGVTAIHPPTGG